MIGGSRTYRLSGRWVTTGRASFNPGDACCLPRVIMRRVVMGLLLVAPKLGILADEPGFRGFV
jgi:hypothetical protein